MDIQKIYSHDSNNRAFLPDYSQVKFGMYVYNPKHTHLHDLNPVLAQTDKIFERSLNVARQRIQPIISEIKEYTKEVILKEKDNKKTYVWDINKNDRKKYLMVFHGTGQNISNLQSLYKEVIDKTDFAVLAAEYTGFGKNAISKISPKTLSQDAETALGYLKSKNIPLNDIYVMGHSAGTYTASKLVKDNPGLGRLILVSSVDSFSPSTVNLQTALNKKYSKIARFLFKYIGFTGNSLSRMFKTVNCLRKIDTPVDIIHSKNDTLINSSSSSHLAAICKNLHSVEIVKTGGHPLEQNKINAVIKALNF